MAEPAYRIDVDGQDLVVRVRRRAPTSGTTVSPRDSTHAMASCATVAPFSPATARRAATSPRLRARFSHGGPRAFYSAPVRVRVHEGGIERGC